MPGANSALVHVPRRRERRPHPLLAREQLRSGDVSPDAAATLVEDAAALASQASAELDRLARAAAAEPLPGQDPLL